MTDQGRYGSWGGLPEAPSKRVLQIGWRDDRLPDDALSDSSCLCHGNGRSYGDSCLNDGATLMSTRGLDRVIAFNVSTGDFECEPGLLIKELLDLTVPYGWFSPVVPGTQFVTIGGAVANDIHGKNHHLAGSFGAHVRSFELLRSDGTRITCSQHENSELFRATIGGLGLTGLITRVRFRLKRVPGAFIEQEKHVFKNLSGFFAFTEAFENGFEHTVAWIDCLSSGRALGRGIMMCGNHAAGESSRQIQGGVLRSVPFTPPFSLVNGFSIRAFNEVFFQKNVLAAGASRIHHRPFFFPLDGVRDWNRIYGRRGFHQYQCVIPHAVAESAIGDMLKRIGRSRAGSFLAVLKRMGAQDAAGLLSFGRPGVTLALDFSNHGARTLELLEDLDRITRSSGGVVYCAKDARMSPESFQAYYPQWRELERLRDPAFNSTFWRRVTKAPS